MLPRLSLGVSVAFAALLLAGPALASGGNYVFAGGSAGQQANVKKALEASAFPWDRIPGRVTIQIGKGYTSSAAHGTIWLDSDLLDSGRFAWGTVQHEYAHQVDFFLLDSQKRAGVASLIGGVSWWQTGRIDHGDLGAERFASTLAWSYWSNATSSMKPVSPNDESAAMAPAKFRAMLKQLLDVPDLVRTQAQASGGTWANPTSAMARKPAAGKGHQASRPKAARKPKKPKR